MPSDDVFTITITNRQHSAILAGLRSWQSRLEDGQRGAEIDMIASCGGRETPLTADEIDDLCEQINVDPN